MCGGSFAFFIIAVKAIWSKRESIDVAEQSAFIGSKSCLVGRVLGSGLPPCDESRDSK
jgi:hypothetical protein